MNDQFVIGVDYGTDSVRSIIVNALNGKEVAASVYYYPRWKNGLYCNASQNQFRQHPQDYIDGLQHTIKACLQQAGTEVAANIKAISVDTTGSTPVTRSAFCHSSRSSDAVICLRAGTPPRSPRGSPKKSSAQSLIVKKHNASSLNLI